jgi:hypothetical protein
MLASVLLAAATLPPVISDPRAGRSSWQLVSSAAPLPAAGAAGYLVTLPGEVSQAVLQRLVDLGARGVPVVALGAAPPPAVVRPYLDGVALDPAPAPARIPDLQAGLGGLPLLAPAPGPAQAVALLAAGAAAVLVRGPPSAWSAALTGLLPEPAAARWHGGELATALRGDDLTTIVGLPAGFPGGEVTLANPWYSSASLAGQAGRTLPLTRLARSVVVTVPALPSGDVLEVARPGGGGGTVEVVQVHGERLPSAAEILARHQRAAARQQRLLSRWSAEQRLLVRVWVGSLGRSFELVLAGPAFHQNGVGTDWEISKAWVDGVAWDPDRLPDLPLLEPKRPPLPPLALSLAPTYLYEVQGREERAGRSCFVLSFTSGPQSQGAKRHGRAWIDAGGWGLVALEETAENLPGDVRSTSSLTSYDRLPFRGAQVWLPTRVVADDLVAVFGGTASVHRELSLSAIHLEPADFQQARAYAYAGPHRMLRDTPAGLTPLVPDGKGGRTVGESSRLAQRFFIAGVVYDPGLSFPVPFGGLQIQDFRFHGRDEQLRALVAGVVNDVAWSKRHGSLDLSLHGFVQLVPFSGDVRVRGKERRAEEIDVRHQRFGAGIAAPLGKARLSLDLSVNYWDFGHTSHTAGDFRLPRDTFEPVAKLGAELPFGPTTVALTGEGGWRQRWEAWGLPGGAPPERTWVLGRLSVVYEKTPFPLAKLHFDGEWVGGRGLDRFSAPAPARFGDEHLRGIPSDVVLPERLAILRASFAAPLGARLRGDVGLDLAWAWERRSDYHGEPLAGIGVGISAPGPWGTLLQASLGWPLATPGPRSPTLELFLLRPLSSRRKQ